SLFCRAFLPPSFRVYGYNGTGYMKPFEQQIQYTHMGSDTAIVTQKIFQLIGLTNAIFTSFNITIILSSLELWIDENKMPVTGDVNELLHKFLKWKRSYLVLRPHDMAFLLVDVMCGKLICKHEGENILESNSAIIIYTNVNGNICVALEYKYDHPDSDKMWVKDGTVCGTNKLCRKQKCIDNDLNYDCTPQKCHNQGVCNNKKNCHCNPKYLPPDCQNEEDSFPGGSVDSGNFLAVATTPAQARNLAPGSAEPRGLTPLDWQSQEDSQHRDQWSREASWHWDQQSSKASQHWDQWSHEASWPLEQHDRGQSPNPPITLRLCV
ncbi:Disintegrin and metalloproteinase domain-containing protein 2, partial [Myotis davidii]